jgi:hypothetical protein
LSKLVRQPGKQDSVLILAIFQAFSFICEGLIFITLGLFMKEIIPIFFLIGVLGFLYYLFRAILWLERVKVENKHTELHTWNRIKEIEIELYGKSNKDTIEKIDELKEKEAKQSK